MRKSSDESRLSMEIEWEKKNGVLLNLTLEDIQAANSLLERLDLSVADAIEAIRCAAWIRPRLFSRSPTPPSKACTAWNRKYPPGTEIRVWALGRNKPCVLTKTATVAFETGGIPVVIVQDRKIGGAALSDCDPVPK